jgi:adenylate kinase
MEIVIFGAPGAGKGTQAKIISQKLGIPHISTGDILRAAVAAKTELGKQVEQIMAKGELVSDELMAKLVEEMLESDKCKNGFILDGYPRTLKQVEVFEEIRKRHNLDNSCLLNIQVDFDVIFKRLTSRLLCVNCNAIVSESEIKEANVCPKCGAKNSLVKRKDDSPEVVKNRLKVYRESTEPILQYYAEHPTLTVINVNGDQPVEKVTEEILTKLENC